MHDKIIVQHYLNILPYILVAVGNPAAVWNVASQPIESLSSVVPGMQPHSDANDTRTASCPPFGKIQQAARDTTSAKCGKHIQVLNLRNLQLSKSGICWPPVHGHITRELSVDGSNKAGAGSRFLFLQVQSKFCFRFDPADARECRRDDGWVLLTQWANLNAPERFRLLKRRYYGLCSHRSVIPNRARKPKSPPLDNSPLTSYN